MIYLERARTFGCRCFWCLFSQNCTSRETLSCWGMFPNQVSTVLVSVMNFVHNPMLFKQRFWRIFGSWFFVQNLQRSIHPVRFFGSRIGTTKRLRKVASMRCPGRCWNNHGIFWEFRLQVFPVLVAIFFYKSLRTRNDEFLLREISLTINDDHEFSVVGSMSGPKTPKTWWAKASLQKVVFVEPKP